METDLGVALLYSVRDSLIWRVTAGQYQRRVFIRCCAGVQSMECRVFGAHIEDIPLTPTNAKQTSGWWALAICNTSGEVCPWSGTGHYCVPVKVMTHRFTEKGGFGELVEGYRKRASQKLKGIAGNLGISDRNF